MKVLCIVCVLVLSAFEVSCNGETYEQKEAKQREAYEAAVAKRQARLTEDVNEFIKKYDSDRTWQDGVKGNTLSTMQLQQSLIRSDGRPILALANLLDIEQREGKFRLLFDVPGLSDQILSKQHLILDLDCSLHESEVKSLKVGEFYAWKDPEYLVAAQVHTIRQTHQFLKTHSRESDSTSSLDTLRMEFVAEGKCVAVQPIRGDKVGAVVPPLRGGRIGKD